MGNSDSKENRAHGGIFNCCSGSNDLNYPDQTTMGRERVIMYSSRSMHQEDSDDEGRTKVGTQFKDTVPLSQTRSTIGPTHSSGTFNLKEQLRLNTGIRPSPNIRMMSFAQRKYMGFRCKYEYDAKALLLSSDKQICLLTYTL